MKNLNMKKKGYEFLSNKNKYGQKNWENLMK